MIFLRAAQREFAQTAAAVLVVLLAILLTTTLVRLLKQTAGGKIPSEAVLALLSFNVIEYLPVVLSLALFVAVLLSISRMYRDSEMTVWFASGQPLTAWVRPVLRFSLPVILLVTALSLYLTPWAVIQRAEYREFIDRRDDVARVVPGTFKESGRGDRVFFVESLDERQTDEGGVRNVFVSSVQHGQLGIIVAGQGHTETAPNGDTFIVLTDGRRYETTAGSAEYRILNFERYAIRTEVAQGAGIEAHAKHASTWSLVTQPTPHHLGELLWRLGLPVSALVLALLAIPLSFVNPRASRSSNLLLALLVFMTYNNLLSVSQAWVGQGRLPFAIGLWAVHLPVIGILLLLFWKRQFLSAWTWRR